MVVSESPATIFGMDSSALEWQDLADLHSPQVFRLAYRLTGNRHDAEDLTQEVFERAFRASEGFDGKNAGGWLHRITSNLFFDRVRRSSKVRMDAFADGDADRFPALDAPPEHVVHQAQLDADVERALASLPAHFRAAVILSDLEGLSYDEVAEALGVKVATVRTRIHRGRRMMRSALAHREPAPGRSRVLGPLVPAT